MIDLTKLTTETRNKSTMDLDKMSSIEIATAMNMEDEKVITAVRDALPQISEVIDICTEKLKGGGRIIYMGAGTSGRLGLLDAVECPPTFGVPSDLVVGLIAGGSSAFIKAVEGAEDSKTLGVEDLKALNVTSKDVVIGIAASG
ncbi:MAG: N-acetylmuramic acid 6-phosphate etherase, partial [Clostridium sp.]|nr:N-acetylmuramic acid 6-phosphate etherase [Clostridium sp.]